MRIGFKGLWLNHDFMKLWVGETVSVFGSQVTALALPLTAVLILKASPLEMGILGAVEMAPFLILSLFVGVWVDRLPRRPILIIADLGRALLLGSIPLASIFNVLNMGYIYVAGLLTGVLTVFFDVAYQSYLPSLVYRAQLVEGNGKLEISRSVAQITGPGLAGTLVQLITAPLAITLDAFSFLISALFVGLIGKREPASASKNQSGNVWAEIGEGLKVVLGSRLLRAIAACTGTSNFFSNMVQAVFVLYAVQELKLEPATLGLVFGAGSVGALVGALVSAKLTQRFGVGFTIIGSAFLFGVGSIVTPLAAGPIWLIILLLLVGQFIGSMSGPIYNITQVSLRQAITPHRLQGRMNASMRFMVWGTMPIGSLLGGLLGGLIGLRPTLLVGSLGLFLPFLWVLFSPVRVLREQPQPLVEDAEAPTELASVS
jgi:MFS family permease